MSEPLVIQATLAAFPIWIFMVLIFIVLAMVVAMVSLVKKSTMRAGKELEERYPGERIVLRDGGNFFGLKSRGVGQVRGNGLLALTEKRIIFKQLIPSKWFEILLERIIDIEHPKSFLGKSVGVKLLQVNFTNDEGEHDAIAWAVREPDKWRETIMREKERATRF